MSREIKLYFKRCTEPTTAFNWVKTLKIIGLKSTFTFVDEINCFKLTAKMICTNKTVFENTKKRIVIVRFDQPQKASKKSRRGKNNE